jgi:hypothetical protein
MLNLINEYLMLGADTSQSASPWLLALATTWAAAQLLRRQSNR